jgi:prepilin-type N-terminal cleavage/methylation domain-containing protein
VSRGPGASGFTLLEVGVALAIVGLGVVICLQIFSGGLKLQERASRDTRAVLYARAVMDALLFEPEVYNHTEQRDVTAEGYRATIVVRDAGPEDGVDFGPDFEPTTDFGLRVLEVRVEWQDAAGIKAYDLRSMRMAPEEF